EDLSYCNFSASKLNLIRVPSFLSDSCFSFQSCFSGFLACSFAPSQYYLLAMADEEPVDQKRYLEEACKPKCVKPLLEYQACVKRIQGDDSGHKHCTGQYFDYWSCIDKCVAPKLFTKLK
uniref:Complex III subunit VI n=1 Tax=Cucumis melo TaxID=3656 RepID=A0A9I9DK00_CUCME